MVRHFQTNNILSYVTFCNYLALSKPYFGTFVANVGVRVHARCFAHHSDHLRVYEKGSSLWLLIFLDIGILADYRCSIILTVDLVSFVDLIQYNFKKH